MGIPSYFSNIIKNFPKIIKSLENYKKSGHTFHNLFMDCNSIIYDVVHSLDDADDQTIIDGVIDKIHMYIHNIAPTNIVYLAFDGVAPFAKMNQQKTRRYKSNFLTNIMETEKKDKWNSMNITPGTQFMRKLSSQIKKRFHNTESKFKIKKMVVSTSDEQGEGEHKLFEYIRNNSLKNENVVIYGLDADLFMLSIFHFEYFKNGYIFREAPEFLKSSIKITDSNETEHYVIDIEILRQSILSEMGMSHPNRIYDYAFMCFLLGNDFLPHFPCLNIRTHGINALLNIYNQLFVNKPNQFLISSKTKKIQWENVKLLIKKLANLEHEYLIQEYTYRNKFDKWNWKAPTTQEEKEQLIQNFPIMYRSEEKYINPYENDWQDRYYQTLFHEDKDIKTICKKYYEGLEWVYSYYIGNDIDWRWHYPYHYGPLFSDLQHYIPSKNEILIVPNNKSFLPEVQLAYVIPKSYSHLLSFDFFHFLEKNYSNNYPETLEFKWAFCKYFWESHISFPEININHLDKWEEFLNI